MSSSLFIIHHHSGEADVQLSKSHRSSSLVEASALFGMMRRPYGLDTTCVDVVIGFHLLQRSNRLVVVT